MSAPNGGFWLPWDFREDLRDAAALLVSAAAQAKRSGVTVDTSGRRGREWDHEAIYSLTSRLNAAAPWEYDTQAPEPEPNPWEAWAVREVHPIKGDPWRVRCRWREGFLEVDVSGRLGLIPAHQIARTWEAAEPAPVAGDESSQPVGLE